MKLKDYLAIHARDLADFHRDGITHSLPVPANEPADGDRCFRLQFGAYGSTVVDVFAYGYEEAFEIAVEWLDDHAPGHLVTVAEAELKSAKAELGLTWEVLDLPECEASMARVVELAERGLTLIGHTTLKHGQYVLSHEWTIDEVTP